MTILYQLRCLDDSHIPSIYAHCYLDVSSWAYLIAKADEMIHAAESLGANRYNLKWSIAEPLEAGFN